MEDLGLNDGDELDMALNGVARKFGVKQVRNRIMMNNKDIPPVTPGRALYNYFRAAYPNNVPLPMSLLRSEAILGATQEIKFNINEAQGNQAVLPTERRLSLNNTFEVVDYSVKIYTVVTPIVTSNFQKAKLYSYVNPFIFSGAGEAASLESIFNSGKLVYKLDNQVLYPAIDVLRFMRIPTSQEGVVTACDNAGVVVGRIARDEYTATDYGFDGCVPSHTLNGNGGNSYTIQLPESVDLSAPAGRTNVAVLFIRGFEGISGTQQKNRKRSV